MSHLKPEYKDDWLDFILELSKSCNFTLLTANSYEECKKFDSDDIDCDHTFKNTRIHVFDLFKDKYDTSETLAFFDGLGISCDCDILWFELSKDDPEYWFHSVKYYLDRYGEKVKHE